MQFRLADLEKLQRSDDLSRLLFARRIARALRYFFNQPLHGLLIAALSLVLVLIAGYLLVATPQGLDLLQRVDGRRSAIFLFSELIFALSLAEALALSIALEGRSIVGPDGERSKKFDAFVVFSATGIAMAVMAGIFYRSWIVWIGVNSLSALTSSLAGFAIIGLELGLRKSRRAVAWLCGVLSVGLLFALAAFPGEMGNMLGSVLVLCTALIAWMLLVYTISIFGFLGGSPGRGLKIAFLLCLALWIVKGATLTAWAMYEGRLPLDYVRKSANGPPASIQTLEEAYQRWKAKFPNSKPKMVLVAAAGGGIRASFWTSLILTRLADQVPNFRDMLFAGSGVSGGSLGLGVAYGLLESDDLDCFKTSHKRESCAREFYRNDFLAGTLSVTMTGLPLNNLLPVFPYRDVALETSWEDAWHRIAAKESRSYHFFERPFVASDDGLKPLPVLMLNATTASSGERAVSANVLLSDEWMKFQSLGCRLALTEKINPPLSAAIGASARFPFVSDPGWVESRGSNAVSRCSLNEAVSDGGFFDNYGAVSLEEVLNYLRLKHGSEFDVVVIQITSDPSLATGCLIRRLDLDQGGDGSVEVPDYCDQPSHLPMSFTALLAKSFFNSGEPSALDIAMQSQSLSGVAAPEHLAAAACLGSYYHFGMTGAGGGSVPLGWTLSRTSRLALGLLLDEDGYRKQRFDRLVAELKTGVKNSQCKSDIPK